MHRSLKTTAAAGLAAAALLAGTTTFTGSAEARGGLGGLLGTSTSAYALGTDGTTLSRLSVNGLRSPAKLGKVTGLVGDSTLVGIDIRPTGGKLYGLGNAGGVYTIDDRARATKVSSLVTEGGAAVALAGSRFGVDFNPAADRLRVISNTGQSLRINVDTGVTAVDTSPNLTPGTAKTGIEAVAYTNNDDVAATASGTSLYDLDAGDDALYQQVPANAGTLVLVGKLGRDFTSISSFDISSRVENGVAVRNKGYFVGTTAGRTGLYTVDLTTGAVEFERRVDGSVAQIAVRHR
ncbi:DUF4394 domain-containing protein [Nocardioides sp.]|uniref:DUF4394 domain-containing protein n=1 Tax=Nocardioides sp. TaxID=35761 RepID=UPI0035195F09